MIIALIVLSLLKDLNEIETNILTYINHNKIFNKINFRSDKIFMNFKKHSHNINVKIFQESNKKLLS